MADQQLKQMLLAYMLLIIKDRALLHEDLDNACEDFLYKEFDHPIDYDLKAALPRLQRWGLVRENPQVSCWVGFGLSFTWALPLENVPMAEYPWQWAEAKTSWSLYVPCCCWDTMGPHRAWWAASLSEKRSRVQYPPNSAV